MSARAQVYRLLEATDPGRLGRSIRLAISLLIILNIAALVVESHLEPHSPLREAFWWFEAISVAVFTLEYSARVWSITITPRYRRPLLGRLRFAATPLALVDLVAILPFYLPAFFAIDLRVARLLRIFRLTRVLKLGRYSTSLQLLYRVLGRKKEDLASTLFILAVLLMMASCLIYFAEHGTQPEKFPTITDSLWWGVATLTTVGYGDVFPVTVAGKIIGSIIAVLGVGVFALPTGIIATGYMEMLAEEREHDRKPCPDCAELIQPTANVCRFCGYRWRPPAAG